MRSSLTPQPGAPLYGPNPQRRERNPSEPPPLTALIEKPIFVKPPSGSQDNRRVNDGPSSLTLGSLVDTQKSVCILRSYSLLSQPYRLHQQNPSTNRSHSVLVLRPQADGKRLSFCCLTPLFQSRFRSPSYKCRRDCLAGAREISYSFSSLPVLDRPMSTSPFQDSSKRGRRLARLS